MITDGYIMLQGRMNNEQRRISNAQRRIDNAHLAYMKFKDKPMFENVIFGHFNSRRFELTYIFESGLVLKCHNVTSISEAALSPGPGRSPPWTRWWTP